MKYPLSGLRATAPAALFTAVLVAGASASSTSCSKGQEATASTGSGASSSTSASGGAGGMAPTSGGGGEGGGLTPVVHDDFTAPVLDGDVPAGAPGLFGAPGQPSGGPCLFEPEIGTLF